MKKMRILDIYIARKFLGVLVFALIAFICIYVIVDLIEKLDQFMGKEVPKIIILKYYLFSLPYIIVLILPVAGLLASLFSVGQMARNNEIVAIKSSGIPLTRILMPLFIIAFFISVAAIFFSENIVPTASVKREDINNNYLEKHKQRSRIRLNNIHIRDEFDRRISIKRLDVGKKIAQQVSIRKLDNLTLISRIDAKKMIWEKDKWVLLEGFQRRFSADGEEEAESFERLELPHLDIDIDRLLIMRKKPEEMSFRELKTFIAEVVRNGGDPDRWLVDLYLKLSFPFANFIIVLFGAPLSSKKQRSSAGVGFGISLAICFFYFGIVKTAQSMGHNGTLSPILAAWLANALFGIVGLGILFKTRQ
jgi:lipopolysaccharide export system permease protein